MKLQFRSVAELRPGPRWKALFDRSWPAYRAWFLRDGDLARADLESSRRALNFHMPELVAVSGGDEQAARMLSLVNPTPFISGCSQAAWTGDDPFLVRNYDYHPRICEGTFIMTAWTGTRVIASSDCLWGVLDGMNEYGVCVSLSFGGGKVVGEGFGIPLILRYVLEVSRTTREAVAHLRRIPCNMAYNVLVVDGSGQHAVVSLAPDHAPLVSETPVATNHQQTSEWSDHQQFSRSEERETFLEQLLNDPGTGPDALTAAFLEPPLFSPEYSRGFGTLYTARYDPGAGRATFLWPGRSWVRSFEKFEEDEYLADYEDSVITSSRRAS